MAVPEFQRTDGQCIIDAIGRLLDSFTPKECANYFANLGYHKT